MHGRVIMSETGQLFLGYGSGKSKMCLCLEEESSRKGRGEEWGRRKKEGENVYICVLIVGIQFEAATSMMGREMSRNCYHRKWHPLCRSLPSSP